MASIPSWPLRRLRADVAIIGQATSNKHQATSNKQQATSTKQQATGARHRTKHQAPSVKRQARRNVSCCLLPVACCLSPCSSNHHVVEADEVGEGLGVVHHGLPVGPVA